MQILYPTHSSSHHRLDRYAEIRVSQQQVDARIAAYRAVSEGSYLYLQRLGRLEYDRYRIGYDRYAYPARARADTAYLKRYGDTMKNMR